LSEKFTAQKGWLKAMTIDGEEKTITDLKKRLRKNRYSERAIKEICKWYKRPTRTFNDSQIVVRHERMTSNLKNDEKLFDKLLIEAVDETFSILGESAKRSIYFHLENNFHIEKDDIPLKTAKFAEALEKIFGVGAKLLKIKIMKGLYRKVRKTKIYGWKQPEDFKLTRYVEVLKQNFLKSQKLQTSHPALQLNICSIHKIEQTFD